MLPFYDPVRHARHDRMLLRRLRLGKPQPVLEHLHAHRAAEIQIAQQQEPPQRRARVVADEFVPLRRFPDLRSRALQPREIPRDDPIVLAHKLTHLRVARHIRRAQHPIKRHAPRIRPLHARRRTHRAQGLRRHLRRIIALRQRPQMMPRHPAHDFADRFIRPPRKIHLGVGRNRRRRGGSQQNETAQKATE